MHLLPEVDCGPKAWTVLKELHALTSVVATLMLERELSALRLSEGEPVQPVYDKMRDLYAKLATEGITYPEQTKCLKMLSLLPESWLQFTTGLSLPQNQSLWTLEWVRTKILEEDFRRSQLRGGDDGSSGYGMQGSRRGRERGFGGAGRGAKKDDDSNDQQGGTGWGRGAKSGRGGKSGAGGKMKGSCWTDRGGEFLGAETTAWLKKQGIQRELTTAYSLQSNGVAERANRTILETARALLIESGVGNSMWPHAVRHATVARNKMLTKVGNESWVPLEKWLGRKPPVDMLRVFGCMAVAHVPKKYRSKLGASAIWCVHLGLAAESNGWLLREPSKGVLFDSRDVKFVEGMMYGGWKKQPETKVSQQMEQITMQLDLTPSVWEEGEEAAAEAGDGEKVQEAPGGGGDDVETSDSTNESAGSEGGEQQLGKAKQAPRQWYLKLRGVLEEIGFIPSTANHSLFMLGEGEQRSFMVVYVDDIRIFSPSSDLVKEVMLKLQDKFKCKALGDVSFYLGLHIERDVEKRCMRVHQRKYLEALAANFGQSEGHVATPFPSGFKCVKGPEEESVGEEERRRFHSLVGSLIYVAVNTRPDVAFATGQLARVVQCPNEEQVAARMRVVKHIQAYCDYNKFVCPPSVKGECALGTDVLEDRQEEFKCFAAAVTPLVSMPLAPEGDPDAPDIPTPRFYAEVIEGPYSSQWLAAMDAEMASWKSTGTYIDEVPPPGANIIKGMWIFRRQGVDFFQTFSPTLKMTTLRVLLHVAAHRNYELYSLDFSTSFLQGSLHEEIWLRRQPGFTGSFPAGTQRSLRRPVYGLRQAPREWHDTLRTTLATLDDLVFATADTTALADVKSELQKRHTCTDLGELTSYLGLRITRDRAQRTITLTQSHMVQQVLQRFGFTYFSPQSTPLPTGHSLSAPPLDESVEPSGLYPELVGCLMYLMTCTRPDLAYPLSLLARYVAPGRHRKARVVLTFHADASWVDDVATQQSSQGYTFSLGSGSVFWRSTRSSSILNSSCEAEIYAGAMAAQELRWLTYLLMGSSCPHCSSCEAEIYAGAMAAQELHRLTYLLTDLGEAPRSPPVVYVDNKAMLALFQEHRLEHRTKHIALRYFLGRELQQLGQLHLAYVASQANTADVFTKAFPRFDHQRFCTVLGLVPTVPHLLTS
ncbi:unnamed protein product [Closterium sp. NIES-53]